MHVGEITFNPASVRVSRPAFWLMRNSNTLFESRVPAIRELLTDLFGNYAGDLPRVNYRFRIFTILESGQPRRRRTVHYVTF
jgi:hypothetical protein